MKRQTVRQNKGMKALELAWRQAQDLALGPYRLEMHLRSLLEAKILAHEVDEAKRLLARYEEVTGPREAPFVLIFQGAIALSDDRLEEGEELLSQVQAFWERTGRRGRAFHVLMFAGQTLVAHGETERAKRYMQLVMEEMERLQGMLSPDLARQMRSSRHVQSALSLSQLA